METGKILLTIKAACTLAHKTKVLQVEFISHGKCHGFVLWIDWVMDAEESIVLSTGPGVSLRSRNVAVIAKTFCLGCQMLASCFLFTKFCSIPLSLNEFSLT